MEKDLEALVARVNFCEGCVTLLKKDVPKYMTKNSEFSKSAKVVADVLKNVASSESNIQLQNILFQCSSRYQHLDKELDAYRQSAEQISMLLDDMKSGMTVPLREIIIDGNNTLASAKKLSAPPNKKQSAAVAKESLIIDDKLELLGATLPVHADLFEKHRVKSMNKLLSTMVHTELAYHIRAIEELSPVFEMLCEQERDLAEY